MKRKIVCRSLSPGQTDRWVFDSSFVRRSVAYVAGAWKWWAQEKTGVREEDTPSASPSRTPVLSFAHYFQAPATQARRSAMPCWWAQTKSKQMHGCCFSVDAVKRMRNIKIAELCRVVIVFRWFTFKTRTLVQTQATRCEYAVLYFFSFPSLH